jgi:hypothetical protein
VDCDEGCFCGGYVLKKDKSHPSARHCGNEVEGMTKRISSGPSNPAFDPAAKKARAEERAIEGAKAMSEYKAEGEAERAKTDRLRALRLAKESAGSVRCARTTKRKST